MTSTSIFAEPKEPRGGRFAGLAAWLDQSDSAETRAARQAVRAWYTPFPDRDGVVLSRLRSDPDDEILQAIDELYAHPLLARSCEPVGASVRGDENSPDFRLYRSPEYMADVEVYTSFPAATSN